MIDMGSAEDRVQELEREHRLLVLGKLEKLDNNINEIRRDISSITSSCASAIELDNLKTEIDKLKAFKNKAVGILIAVNTAAIFVGWAIETFMVAYR